MPGLKRATLGAVVAAAAIVTCGPVNRPAGPLTPARPPTGRPPLEPAPDRRLVNPNRPITDAEPVDVIADGQWLRPLPPHMRPGRHTLTLDVAESRTVSAAKAYDWACGVSWPGLGPEAVGWGQSEDQYSNACAAVLLQRAVLFDTTMLDQVPDKVIEQAIVSYEEVELQECGQLGHQGIPVGFVECWTNGNGEYEFKLYGCVDVRVPSEDWRAGPPRLFGTAPEETALITRRPPREWDVTVPFNYQAGSGVPLGGVRRYGFLLSGWPWSLDALTAQDNTVCISRVTNVQLHVTYYVPGGPGFVPPN
jgi:hypothetical protein